MELSIIIPHYNRKKLLMDCLDSIAANSYPKENYEVIVVDDCSSEDIEDIRNYDKFKNYSFLRLGMNSGGASIPRNCGINNSTGEYLLFIDSDDTISDNFLENSMAIAKEGNCDAVTVPKISERSSAKGFKDLTEDVISMNFEEPGKHSSFMFSDNYTIGKLYRSSLIKRFGIRFPEELKKSEDSCFSKWFWAVTKTVGICVTASYFLKNGAPGENLSFEKLNDEDGFANIYFLTRNVCSIPNEFVSPERKARILNVRIKRYYVINLLESQYYLGLLNKKCGKYFKELVNLPQIKKTARDFMNAVINYTPETVSITKSDVTVIEKVNLNSDSITDNLMIIHKNILCSMISLRDYIYNLKNILKYYTVAIIVGDTPVKKNDRLVFNELGATQILAYRNSYIFVSEMGNIVFEQKNSDKIEKTLDLKIGKTKIRSAAFGAKVLPFLNIENKEEIPLYKTGINIIVFASESGEVMDNVCFDCYNNITIRNGKNIGKVNDDYAIKSVNDNLEKLNDNLTLMCRKSADLLYMSESNRGEDFETVKKEFFLNFPKASGKLRELQMNSALMLRVFYQMCKEAGVQCWVEGGTLIGAIRHEGFIPWDDDVDISIMHDDFIKLVRFQANSEKFKDFELNFQANFQANADFMFVVFRHKDFPFAHFNKLDVFIYVSINNQKASKLKNPRKKLELLMRPAFYDAHKGNLVKNSVRTENMIDAVDDMEKIVRIYREKVSLETEEKNDKILRVPVFGHLLNKRKVFNTKDIFPLVPHKFEDFEVFVPNNFVEVLNTNFGVWNDIPQKKYLIHFGEDNINHIELVDKMTQWNKEWSEKNADFFD